jgi:predicted transcriptional regulator
MSHVRRTIEVDAETAEGLEAIARERGTSVPRLLAELVGIEREVAQSDSVDIAELDRRHARIKAGGETVPHERVVRWLQSWGTPSFRPWRQT